MSWSVKYVGLDVHKDTIAVAVADDGKRAEVRELGEIANTPAALMKLLGKLGGPVVELHICYEAGPCGYGIQRQVTAAGYSCAVVAPSLIPRRSGDRFKARWSGSSSIPLPVLCWHSSGTGSRDRSAP